MVSYSFQESITLVLLTGQLAGRDYDVPDALRSTRTFLLTSTLIPLFDSTHLPWALVLIYCTTIRPLNSRCVRYLLSLPQHYELREAFLTCVNFHSCIALT